jgi:hypothetical protein
MPEIHVVIEYWVLLIPLVLHGLRHPFHFRCPHERQYEPGHHRLGDGAFFFPYVAVFLYLMFGSRRIHDYAAAHQSGTTDIHHLGKMLRQDSG